MPAMTLVIDAKGHRCPVPTLRLRRALDGLKAGERVELVADDPMARIDVPHFVREGGHALMSVDETADGFRFLVRKGG